MTTIESYLNDIWKRTTDYMIDTLGADPMIINTYFVNSKLINIDHNNATIIVDNEIGKQILLGDSSMVETALSSVMDDKISFTVLTKIENKLENNKLTDNNFPSDKTDDDFFQIKLKPDFTFENFVVGQCNNEAKSAALACAYNPGKFYTPLFIYGNSGLGKTHLLQAIGNYVKKKDPSKKVYYTSGSDFVESVVSSIQNQCIDQFKRKLYELDVLLMDDVQFIAGKEKSHEVFFSIFNELVNNRKQICITSDKHPTEIKGLEERLISRFSSGLSVGVDSPEFETAVAILRLKINNQVGDTLQIDDEVIAYLATHFSKDVRQLEGCINRLLFMTINTHDKDHIDLNSTIEIFKGQVNSSSNGELSVNRIKKEVADYYGLTKQQLASKSRTSQIANARHIAMYLCRKLLDIPFVKIGEEFGKRDHSTVISACEKVEKNIKKDILYQHAVNELETRIKGH